MTTIATDGKSMAGDSLTSGSNTILRFAPKVLKAPDGRIFGCCGLVTDCLKFQAWMLNGGDQPELTDDFDALILNTDGTVDWIDKNYTPVRYMVPHAIGSGSEYALGAMFMGADPAKAVEIAMIRDLSTGGDITSEALA